MAEWILMVACLLFIAWGLYLVIRSKIEEKAWLRQKEERDHAEYQAYLDRLHRVREEHRAKQVALYEARKEQLTRKGKN